MAAAEVLIACSGAAGAGFFLWLFGAQAAKTRIAKRRIHLDAARTERPELEAEGASARIIGMLCAQSKRSTQASGQPASALIGRLAALRSYEGLVAKAGLGPVLTREGCAAARLLISGYAAGTGLVVGLCLSTELGVLLALAGGVMGWRSPPWALRRESKVRSERLEGHLSEMIEVVSLGLRSGLAFDRAFELYHRHFSTGLARACKRAQRQWVLGLIPREEALHALAHTYDSPLFARVVDNITRSLRFGSSLAESLEAAAAEARSVHRAQVEERVAKAPVKMLVPTGTLILPAMLILVLGPILLELMQGF